MTNEETSLSALPHLLRLTRHTSRWVAPLGLDGGYSLAARIRGAWGQRLLALSKDGIIEAQQCRAAMFAEKLTGGNGYAPYLFAADVIDGILAVTITLIGTARQYMDAAFNAMEECLGTEPGLDLGNGQWRPLQFLGSHQDQKNGVSVRSLGIEVSLDFVTPLRIGPQNALGTNFSDIVFSIADRAANLVKFESLTVPIQKSVWRDMAKRQRYDASKLQVVHPFTSWSSYSGPKKRMGYIGRLVIRRPTKELEPILALGQYLHAGAHVAEGFGRYQY